MVPVVVPLVMVCGRLPGYRVNLLAFGTAGAARRKAVFREIITRRMQLHLTSSSSTPGRLCRAAALFSAP